MVTVWDLLMLVVQYEVNKCILCTDWKTIHRLSFGWMCLS